MNTSVFDHGWPAIGEFLAALIFFLMLWFVSGRGEEWTDDPPRP